jgi:hypothetical protein
MCTASSRTSALTLCLHLPCVYECLNDAQRLSAQTCTQRGQHTQAPVGGRHAGAHMRADMCCVQRMQSPPCPTPQQGLQSMAVRCLAWCPLRVALNGCLAAWHGCTQTPQPAPPHPHLPLCAMKGACHHSGNSSAPRGRMWMCCCRSCCCCCCCLPWLPRCALLLPMCAAVWWGSRLWCATLGSTRLGQAWPWRVPNVATPNSAVDAATANASSAHSHLLLDLLPLQACMRGIEEGLVWYVARMFPP